MRALKFAYEIEKSVMVSTVLTVGAFVAAILLCSWHLYGVWLCNVMCLVVVNLYQIAKTENKEGKSSVIKDLLSVIDLPRIKEGKINIIADLVALAAMYFITDSKSPQAIVGIIVVLIMFYLCLFITKRQR